MDKDVARYIESITDKSRKKDVQALVQLITNEGAEAPKMWGTSIIAFGLYRYKYESGREGEAPKIGLSNRKQAIVIYGLHISDPESPNAALLGQLGTYETGKGCLYIPRLNNIDLGVFKKIIRNIFS